MIHEVIIPSEYHGLRLDVALAKLLPQYSRSQIRACIKDKKIRKCIEGEKIVIEVISKINTEWHAQKIDFPIVYEDDQILIINKPVGLVVHPGSGNSQNTLANALLNYLPELNKIPRVGIVHRLDKDTSGLLVVAKTLEAQHDLVNQLEKREIHREYYAVVNGVLISGGTIETLMGRHAVHRQKMAVLVTGGKEAITHYRVVERFRAHTLIKVLLETGRTHQIRVHMAHKGYPLLGDKLYGARPILPKFASEELINKIRLFKYQALHAKKLVFTHPTKKERVEFNAPLPKEMEELIGLLKINMEEEPRA